jgi:rhamnosyltransferase subunit B
MRRPRVLLATFGSLGDLHPMVALAGGLASAGFDVRIASSALHRARVESAGIEFVAIRPDVTPDDATLTRRVLDRWRGPAVLVRELMMRPLRETYDDLAAAAHDADLLLAGEIVYAAPLVAEKLCKPWMSVILAPFSFLSALDSPVYPNLPWRERWSQAPASLQRVLRAAARRHTRPWFQAVDDLRAELGLRASHHPLFDDKYSVDGTLALFSPMLGAPQRDWPEAVVQCGFVWHDGTAMEAAARAELERFLAAGDAPIVFTLGSSAVFDPGEFYSAGLAAARALGRRALLLAGGNAGALQAAHGMGGDLAVFDYAPHSLVFPQAAAIVHQGGVGTTAQALRAGRPQLVVPFAFDQPDNAARVERLGVARVLARHRFTAARAVPALQHLLEHGRPESGPHRTVHAHRAVQVAARIHEDCGLQRAIHAIHQRLTGPTPTA